ncbi:glycosyltransferase family 4 protein [Altericroceibacterium xinjiangense]|uniref:glycosyltransferase family 4 protein n=1 Tax=Altericroceibacterium xinjiangense TaxID=762261 RepID=UPI000F7EF4F6|nr:glycosyltransferase family 4 protein [Altericroceibacterium xinjiangense]
MHIGLCSPHWPPGEGANGIVSYVAAVREHFVAQGHLVSVISRNRSHSSDGTTLELGTGLLASSAYRIDRRLNRSPGTLPHIARAVGREIAELHRLRPLDIVEMEESFGWSAVVGRRIAVPVVTRLHGPHFLKPASHRTALQEREDRSRCEAEAHAVRSAPFLTAPTRAVMESTCDRCGRSRDQPSAVIPNPIKVDSHAPQWSLADCERDHILMVGRFDFVKGADTLLAAFGLLLDVRPSARLTIVGPDFGIETTPGKRLNFDAYVRANLSPQARERITFTGLLRPEEIRPLRLKANVTVASSRTETFGYVLVEAMAAGSPLISTDWPGSEELIVHRKTGLLTPVADPDAMARNLEWLLANPEAAAQMGAAGKRRCSDTFSVDLVGNRLLDCYEATIRAVA